MALDFNVNLAPQVAMQMIDNGIVNGSLSGERIDYYEVHNTAGYLCITAVYEKFYYRAGNRLTLTVIIDNMRGTTHVHAIGGGGGNGAFFKFDWARLKRHQLSLGYSSQLRNLTHISLRSAAQTIISFLDLGSIKYRKAWLAQ